MKSYIDCPLCGERNSAIFSFCKKCGSELPSTTKPVSNEESSDVFDQGDRINDKSSFNIEKSRAFEETYRIYDPDGHDFIFTRRSALNRIGIYIFFLLAFALIAIWGIVEGLTDSSEFGEVFINYLIRGILQILLGLGLLVVANIYGGLRRINVYNENEVYIGAIRGNLFFTRWRVIESSKINNISFRFGLFRSKGEMETSFGSFSVAATKDTALVQDVNNVVYFSVHSLDSIYKRRRFRIDSNAQLNPLLICLASVCIIERKFRPKTEPD